MAGPSGPSRRLNAPVPLEANGEPVPGFDADLPIVAGPPSPPVPGLTLRAPTIPGAAAQTVLVPITLDNEFAITGLSFGLEVGPGSATLESVDLGAELQALRCGAGPDFAASAGTARSFRDSRRDAR